MSRQPSGQQLVRLLLGLLLAIAAVFPSGSVGAQVQQGATLTILRGQVAVLRPNGTAIQPAPSGSIVDVGDEIRTIARSGALITLFAGTEIEMGEETILVVEQLSRQGDKIDVSLRQVLGATVNRVQSLTGTGSTYQIQAGGAVALVRGTTFALVGPVTTPSGNVVTIACREDCTPSSTFHGCAMAPFTGLGVTTSGGKVELGCQSFRVDRSTGLFDAAFYGVTTVEQAVQGDTNGVPAGQVNAGSRQEIDARFDAQQREAQQKDQQTDPPVPQGQPSAPGTRPCNSATQSGGFVTDTKVYDLGRTTGTFTFTYQAFGIPDRFQVITQGNTLLDTGNVSGGATVSLALTGSPLVTVIVIGSGPGTAWNYIVSCPT